MTFLATAVALEPSPRLTMDKLHRATFAFVEESYSRLHSPREQNGIEAASFARVRGAADCSSNGGSSTPRPHSAAIAGFSCVALGGKVVAILRQSTFFI
ncbi:MAG TPA: hypothetical protein VMV45_20180 [Casimicrobiaceae bacterium]|nr:hypothetical protein [Casimicrobiaceae bacterium]